MAKPFDVATEAPRFALPLHTREQIAALMVELTLDAREVVVNAVAAYAKKTFDEPEQDVVADVDRILKHLGI